MKLVLASTSPRRIALLRLLDLEFEIIAADIDESALHREHPAEMTRRLARLKASAVFDQGPPDRCVLGGDTAVALGGEALGKPANRDEAISMLKRLSGTTHIVYSAVALAQSSGCTSLLSQSRVTFRTLDEPTILQYCDTGDPYDKAGAYGIQGPAGSFVTRLDGTYSGVMGLPLWHTHLLLFNQAPD